ncbi:MAG: alpha/beta fold hydrolase [Cytophagales bacterium]|nr:MAG: alpha/beta fold hydrolase [Cytophagales bacterium]
MLHYKTYELAKDKDWVIFIHGAGGSSSIWYKQIREFKPHFNILLVDLRGHGKSKQFIERYMQNKYTFHDIGLDVIEVMDFLKIQSAHFVSISLGSIIVRSIGEVQPNRILSMTLGGAIIRLNIRSKILMNIANKIKKMVPYMWIYTLFAWIIMPRSRHKESRSMFIREAKRLYQKEFLRWYQLTAEVNPLLRFFHEKELPVPTLYIMGDEDHMFLPQVKQVIKKHQYGLLEVLQDCGHVVNIDQSDIFNKIAIRFIQNPQKYELGFYEKIS